MIQFPVNVTNEERTIDWYKIAEIKDSDFGFNTPKEKTGKTRFCVRLLMPNDKGEFCVIKSEKYGYMQLPGGGIDEGENIADALRRETKEETGFLIKDMGTNYMDDEIAEGFKPIWIKLENFIAEQQNNEGKIESYSGCFSNRRDLEIAKYFKLLKVDNNGGSK